MVCVVRYVVGVFVPRKPKTPASFEVRGFSESGWLLALLLSPPGLRTGINRLRDSLVPTHNCTFRSLGFLIAHLMLVGEGRHGILVSLRRVVCTSPLLLEPMRAVRERQASCATFFGRCL